MNGKILFVDDDANLLASFQRSLRQKFAVEIAEGAECALQAVAERGPFAVVVADRQMPGMDGIQLLSLVRERAPDTVRIMLTGNADLEGAIKVVNEGNIFRFLTKPCPADIFAKALLDGLAQYRLATAEKELLNKTLSGSVKLLTDILSIMDPQSFGRAQAIRDVITGVTRQYKLENDWEIYMTAMLAAIGNVVVPSETLVRARSGLRLSEAEEQILANAPATAARLLSNIPRLEDVARAIRYQHKQYDGKGFPPDAVKGDAIPFGARLLKILSDMTDLERGGLSRAKALAEMESRMGLYDPNLLQAVCAFYGLSGAAYEAARPSICVALSDLTAGMVLRSDIETVDGTLILATGHQLNEMTLEKIRNFSRLMSIKEPIFVEAPEKEVVEAAVPQLA